MDIYTIVYSVMNLHRVYRNQMRKSGAVVARLTVVISSGVSRIKPLRCIRLADRRRGGG